MDASAINFLLSINPNMKEIKGIKQFFKLGLHWKMEQNDTKNNIKWFNNMKEKGWKPCMDAHREGCRGVFDFDNYDTWSNRDIVLTLMKVDDDDDDYMGMGETDSDISDDELEFVSVKINGIRYYRQMKNGKYYEILDNLDVGDEVEIMDKK